ncbi:MAG: TfoX/Sxy family protein [Burkholderiales bacterium]|nr:TfoX/Sxy family protein [Burkholderiales bacterium]
MASDLHFVEYVCEQAGRAPALSHRKMFGEYALYMQGKVVGLVCDNLLFVKPTLQGKAVLGATTERPPYPGAKPYFHVAEELEDQELMQRLFRVTALALPPPRPKSTKAPTKPVRSR